MALYDELKIKVNEIFSTSWTSRDGRVVPDTTGIRFENDAVIFKGAVLYADITESTVLVDTMSKEFASEVYKTYLYCAGRIIKAEGGAITAYDGDRVMAIFMGEYKNTNAVTAALKINYAVHSIVSPLLAKQYDTDYRVSHSIGVDRSELWAVKTGVRDDNDIVWVGQAANHAAKLAGYDSGYSINITKIVYDGMQKILREDSEGQDPWSKLFWNETNRTIYATDATINV